LYLISYQPRLFIISPFSNYIYRWTFQKYFTGFVTKRLTLLLHIWKISS
jgi:hypothetical protein